MRTKLGILVKKGKRGKTVTYDGRILEARKSQAVLVEIPEFDQSFRLTFSKLNNGWEVYSAEFFGMTIWIEYTVERSFKADHKPLLKTTVARKSKSGIPKPLQKKK